MSHTATLSIVPMYAALLGLLFFYLSFLVIRQRYKAKIGLGDGDIPALKRAIAAHSNFNQYVPICMILLAFIESSQFNIYVIHALGAALLLGRMSHAYGISQEPEVLIFRQIGMALTFTVLIGASIVLLIYSII
jgi:uncharacterized protein